MRLSLPAAAVRDARGATDSVQSPDPTLPRATRGVGHRGARFHPQPVDRVSAGLARFGSRLTGLLWSRRSFTALRSSTQKVLGQTLWVVRPVSRRRSSWRANSGPALRNDSRVVTSRSSMLHRQASLSWSPLRRASGRSGPNSASSRAPIASPNCENGTFYGATHWAANKP